MEPLNNGHIWDEIFVHFSVVVLSLGRNVKKICRQLANVECPLLEASLYMLPRLLYSSSVTCSCPG